MSSGPVIYSGTFIWQKSDGTSEKITVPGKYKVPAGETMVLISQLPVTLQETDIAIRSSLHEKEPAQNGDHQDIKKVSFSSVEGKGFFFHRISSLRLGVQSMRDSHLIIALL